MPPDVSHKRNPETDDDDGPLVLNIIKEEGLKGSELMRRSWPKSEVMLNVDTCSLSVLKSKRAQVQEFLLEGSTVHHSRVTSGFLGICWQRKGFQLLFTGTPEAVCRLLRQIMAAMNGRQQRSKGTECYKHLQGVPSKRQRRELLDTLTSGALRDEGAGRAGSQNLGGLSAEALMLLTVEQRGICEVALRGESLFFTGGAGTGKSFLLKQVLQALGSTGTAVTASTALAASHLGGTTLHKWASVGRGEADVVTLARELKRRADSLYRWRNTRTLVIDEISMVDGDFFAKLEVLARAVRGNDRPFGGLQLILAGDFLQLPPVSGRGNQDRPGQGVREQQHPRFCFEVPAWKTTITRTFELTEVFRQKGDDAFCTVLNEMRLGHLSEASVKLLLPRLVAGIGAGHASATRLMPLRSEVERVNQRALAALPGTLEIFEARDTGDSAELDRLTSVRQVLELRVGALVLLTRTLDVRRKLVNGTQGKVKSFTGSGSLRQPVVEFIDLGTEIVIAHQAFEARVGNVIVGVRTQLPLELAWAVSVHKSQGMTLNSVEVSLDSVFEDGQAYVALSRARSLQGVYLVGNEDSLRRSARADPRCLAFHQQLTRKSMSQCEEHDKAEGCLGAESVDDSRKAPGEAESQAAPSSQSPARLRSANAISAAPTPTRNRAGIAPGASPASSAR